MQAEILLAWIVIAVLSVVAIPAAFIMDRRLHHRNPDLKSYKWGYYIGWLGALGYGIWSIIFIALGWEEYGRYAQEYYVLAFWMFIGCITQLGLIFRNKWLSIAGIVAQWNPIFWIINGIYIRNRWYELSGFPTFAPMVYQRFLCLNLALRLLIAGAVFWVFVVSIFVLIFEPYGWRVDWEHLTKVVIFPPLVAAVGYFIFSRVVRGSE